MRHFLLFAWLFAFFAGSAQTEDLEKSLLFAKGNKRLTILETLSKKLENSDIKRATKLAKEGVSLARLVRNQQKEQQLSGWLGYLFRLQNEYDSSALLYNQAVAIAHNRHDDVGRSEYLNGLSQLERAQGKLAVAISHALEARTLSDRAGNPRQSGEALYNIGYVYLLQRSYDSALLFFLKSLDVRRGTGDSTLVAGSYNAIGLVLMRMEDYDKSIAWFMKAASLIDSSSSPRLLAMVYNNTGVTLENQGKLAEGREYYYKSIALKKRMGDARGLASTYGNLGDNFRESGNPDEAIKFAVLSLKLSIETKSLDYLITAHKLQALAYEQKKDYKNAYENFVLFHDFQDSLFNASKARQVHEMLARYNVEKKDQENKMLKASAALNESTLTRQKFIIIVVAISLGVVLFLMNFLYKMYSRSKTLAVDLALQKAEADQANTQLTMALQDNINLTNFMVHDLRAPMNKVAAFTDLIQHDGSLNPRQAMYASKVMEMVEQGRKLIDDLLTINKPTEVNRKQLDWNNFIQDLIREYSSIAAQKNIDVRYNLPDNPILIESDRELLGRAMDNLLSNAVKFSPQGSTITVSVKEDTDRVSVSVTDEGPGFTEDDLKSLYQKFKRLSARPTNGEPSNGLGLAIAKTIVVQLGGKISLYTKPGNGSTFTVELPGKF